MKTLGVFTSENAKGKGAQELWVCSRLEQDEQRTGHAANGKAGVLL